jgi:hypothetical protein
VTETASELVVCSGARRSSPRRPGSFLLALAGILAAGCVLDAPDKNACTTTDRCLRGYTCIDRQCVRTPAPLPDGGADGGGDTGGGSRSTCDLSMPFGAPVLVYGLNRDPGTEYRLNLSADELTAYVSAGSAWWSANLFMSTRASRTGPFGPLVALATLDSGDDVSISVTADGLTAFFDRTFLNGSIFASKRVALDQPFETPSQVLLDRNMPQEYDAYVLPDGSALYFTAVLDPSMPGGQMLRSALHGTDADPPVVVPLIPLLVAAVRFPVVSADELTLYFSAPGSTDTDEEDIWVTSRSSRDAPFTALARVTELSTSDWEVPQWISPDGCRLYFARTYATDGADSFLFVAERTPPAAPGP